MKIKTITCHNVYNAGASLQAYALMRYLQNLGHDVEIIDYVPDYLRHYSLLSVSPKYDRPFIRQAYIIWKLPKRLKALASRRKKEYDAFTHDFLRLTQKKYVDNDALKRDPPEADVYIAGSDQIWNTLFPNGKDPAFYLDFAPDSSTRASYAASFATETISSGYEIIVGKWLSRLDYISVRESSGVSILESLGIDRAVQVTDPVFLISREQWNELCLPKTLEHYILVCDFDESLEIRDFVLRMAHQKDLKIYSVLSCDYADKNFSRHGPRTFLSLIRDAEYVVSNSFHATAFSLIFQKPFAVFDRAEKINTRMRDLLSTFRLQRENDLEAVLQAQNQIQDEIQKSKKYLDIVLKRGASL